MTVNRDCQLADGLDRPGFLGGCDLWESWGSWHHGNRIPRSCGNARWRWCSRRVLRRGNARGSIARVGHRLGINTETLRNWVQKAEVDSGQRPGTTSDDKKRIAELEREVRELRRANEILKAASAYFARELDPRFPR
jgi:transposase